MSTRNGSPARVILPMFAMSALVAVSFIAAIVLFLASLPTIGMIALSIAGFGFVALFFTLRNEIHYESKQGDAEALPETQPVAPMETWEDFVNTNGDFLFSPDTDESNTGTGSRSLNA